jgi:hypothetical protein
LFPQDVILDPFLSEPSDFSWFILTPVHSSSLFCGLLRFIPWTHQTPVLLISGNPFFVDPLVNLLQCDFIIEIRDNRIVSLDISITMDPLWVKVKGYLKHFEEILEGIQRHNTMRMQGE